MEITRRSFFKRAGLLFGAAIIAPKLLLPKEPVIKGAIYGPGKVRFDSTNFGCIDGITRKRWSKALFEEVARKPYFDNFIKSDNPIINILAKGV